MAIRAAIEFSVPFAQCYRTCSTISFHSERVSIQSCSVSPPPASGASGQGTNQTKTNKTLLFTHCWVQRRKFNKNFRISSFQFHIYFFAHYESRRQIFDSLTQDAQLSTENKVRTFRFSCRFSCYNFPRQFLTDNFLSFSAFDLRVWSTKF